MIAMLLCSDILMHSDNVLYILLVSCPSLSDPSNGMINCSLGDNETTSYEDTCSFTCNTGYELTGSDTRTCQSDRSWSGSDTVCSRSEYNLLFILARNSYNRPI